MESTVKQVANGDSAMAGFELLRLMPLVVTCLCSKQPASDLSYVAMSVNICQEIVLAALVRQVV